MPCIPSALQPSVLAFYPFSNGSLNDFSGNNNNLTNNSSAAPVADRNGNPNCAFNFVDSLENLNELVSTSNTAFLNGLTEFSISLWYKPFDSLRSSILPEMLVCRTQNPNGMFVSDALWYVALFDCRKAVFDYRTSAWDQNIYPIGGTTTCWDEAKARTGSWHHLAATYNLTAQEVKIYRDGILQNTTSIAANTPLMQDVGDLLLGRRYRGEMDDVVLLEKTLTSAEVIQLRDMEPCCLKD